MWYINSICFVRHGVEYRPGERVPVRYIYHDDRMRGHFILELSLLNTDTGDSVTLVSTNWQKFVEQLHEYDPYGWVPGGYVAGDAMYLAIDKVSIDFLECVDKVESVAIPDGVKEFIRNLPEGFGFLDDMRSIVDCSSSFVQHAFTLFQTMCFLQKGWIGDRFYIRNKTG